MSSDPGWDDTEFDRELEEDPGAERNGVHRPNGERILFPAAYTFRTEGPSLQVLDGDGRVAVVFAQGAWEFAISTGAKFKWEWDAGERRQLAPSGLRAISIRSAREHHPSGSWASAHRL
jgi:hypothetical protein